MEFYKDKNGYSKLIKRNVDTGLGLERMAMLLQGKETPYEIELFAPVMEKLEKLQKMMIFKVEELLQSIYVLVLWLLMMVVDQVMLKEDIY